MTVRGLPAYPSPSDVPGPIDLAVIAVPGPAVLSAVDQCAAAGVRGLVVVSAGFAETGPEGAELQRQLVARARAAGARLLGPNCQGLVATGPGVCLNASFAPTFPPAGRVALAAESGAVALTLLAEAQRAGLGVSACVSVGNGADVSSTDLLEYWEADPDTGVILLYLESFPQPERFARLARRAGRRKPVVVLKAGRSGAGQRAAGSHTAALADDEAFVNALIRQSGAIRADSLEELFDLALALADQPLPAGRRVGVLANAGGPAILCADACAAGGLELPELSVATQADLAGFLPANASLVNPVELISSATPEQYRQASAAVLASGEVDALIVIAVRGGVAAAQDGQAIDRGIGLGVAEGRRLGATHVPVLACRMPEAGASSLALPGGERVPCYPFPDEPARALARLAEYAEWRDRPEGALPCYPNLEESLAAARAVCREALAARGPGWLGAAEAARLLAAAGLPLCSAGVASTAEGAVALARRLGFPVALKLASHRFVHKTEVHGIQLGIADEEGVLRAFAEMRERFGGDFGGALVQRMVGGGTEVLVGLTRAPRFGPLVAFGLGGTHVEALGDICFRLAPLTDRDAAEMVRGVRGYRLLEGYRGAPSADVPALEEVLLRVSCLASAVPELLEVDLNPVFALPPGQGCLIADARARVGPAR
jgi:acyl-CoA synthetase (NDP forming)